MVEFQQVPYRKALNKFIFSIILILLSKIKKEKNTALWPRAFYKLLFAFASQPPEAMHAATAPTRFQSR